LTPAPPLIISPNSTPAIFQVEDAGMPIAGEWRTLSQFRFGPPLTNLQEIQMFYSEYSDGQKQNMTVRVSPAVERLHLEDPCLPAMHQINRLLCLLSHISVLGLFDTRLIETLHQLKYDLMQMTNVNFAV
jgi:hypothetical protein